MDDATTALSVMVPLELLDRAISHLRITDSWSDARIADELVEYLPPDMREQKYTGGCGPVPE